MKARCWYFQKVLIQKLMQKRIPHCYSWAANHWVNDSYGGILFHQEEKELSRRKKTGRTEELFCLPTTIKNLFRCLKTNQNLRLLHRHRKCFLKHLMFILQTKA